MPRAELGNMPLIEDVTREVWGNGVWLERVLAGLCGMRCGSYEARRDSRLASW